MSAHKPSDAFERGYVIACANIVNLHDETVVAADVLRELGVTWPEVVAMDLCEYDMRALRSLKVGPRNPFARRRRKRLANLGDTQ